MAGVPVFDLVFTFPVGLENGGGLLQSLGEGRFSAGGNAPLAIYLEPMSMSGSGTVLQVMPLVSFQLEPSA